MAHTPFRCEVLTPEGSVFDGDVEMVSTGTTIGTIGILARHTPVLGVLEPTELRLYLSDTEILRFAQSEGYLQVADSHAMLLVEEAIAPDQLNVAELRDKLAEADRELAEAGEDTAKRRFALANKRRYEAFIGVAESASGATR
jgi:F-type H+-transporting ATPase subunit epsilon